MAHQWTDIQRKWAAALRSGEYRQGRGRLAHAGRYCCLGVGCMVVEGGPSGAWRGRDEKLPTAIQKTLGLRDSVGGIPTEVEVGAVQVKALAAANDDGATFTEIADFIEANPEQVFVQPEEDWEATGARDG